MKHKCSPTGLLWDYYDDSEGEENALQDIKVSVRSLAAQQEHYFDYTSLLQRGEEMSSQLRSQNLERNLNLGGKFSSFSNN